MVLRSLAVLAVLAAPVAAQRAQTLPGPYVQTLDLSRRLNSTGSIGGVAADADGFLYVADFGSSIWRVSPGGEATRLSRRFQAASGNTVTPDGRLLQSDYNQNLVWEVDRATGQRMRVVQSGLNGPVGVAQDVAGDVYVCNCNNNQIRRAPAGSNQAVLFAASPLFNCPNGITIGPDGDLFVINFFDDRLLRVDPAGNVSVFATLGKRGLGGGHIARIGDELYVTMFNSQNLFRVSLASGATAEVAGREGRSGLQDGPPQRSLLRGPNGIAADPSGRFLTMNNLIGPVGSQEMVLRRLLLP